MAQNVLTEEAAEAGAACRSAVVAVVVVVLVLSPACLINTTVGVVFNGAGAPAKKQASKSMA